MAKETSYYARERYDDLNRTFKKVLLEGNFGDTDKYITQYAAMCKAVEMPSKQFWVSPERLMDVITAMEKHDCIDKHVSTKSPRYEMYIELYKRYTEYKKEHPDLSRFEICCEIIYQPAPKFYIKPSWGLKILCKGRSRSHRLRRNKE